MALDTTSNRRICYYDLLGVDPAATDRELKLAYRKKALLLHPDKNLADPETAQQRFILVQHAYDTLSDANERAWYDANRDQILSAPASVSNPLDPTTWTAHGTTADQLFAYFSPACFPQGFSDQPSGFFAVYTALFAELAREEKDAGAKTNLTDVPFGKSQASRKTVDAFYAHWEAFSSAKSFAWNDKWKLSDAPDRRVRRLMEKENEKLREADRKKFTETVRKLVEFVKKRDPRVKAYAAASEAERAAKHKAHLERLKQEKAARQDAVANYVEPEWARVKDEDLDALLDDLNLDDERDLIGYQGGDQAALEQELVDLAETLFCVVCDLDFLDVDDPEVAIVEHVQSKAHRKRLAQFRHDMVEEEQSRTSTPLPLPKQFVGQDSEAPEEDEQEPEAASRLTCEPCGKSFDSQGAWDAHCKNKKHLKAVRDAAKKPAPIAAAAVPSPSSKKKQPAPAVDLEAVDPKDADESDDDDDAPAAKSAKAKRAARAAKKAAAAAAAVADPSLVDGAPPTHACNVCKQSFSSRSKLFDHVRDSGHALAKKFDGDEEDWDSIVGHGKKSGKRKK